jgi:hypothetical protein
MPKKLNIHDYTCKYCKKNNFEFVTVDDGKEFKEMKLIIDHKPCLYNALELLEFKIFRTRERLWIMDEDRQYLLMQIEMMELGVGEL